MEFGFKIFNKENLMPPPALSTLPTSAESNRQHTCSPSAPPKRDGYAMHIGGLSSDITDEGIRNVCSNYGSVLQVKKIHPTACLVTFNSSHDVDLAIHQINADAMQLGWQASHKKRFSNSRSSAGGGTTSDSESSVVFVPTTKAEAADRRSAPVVRPATDEDQHQRAVHVNWAARKFTGPFGQPTAVTMPKGMRTALPRDPAAASQKYADDPDVMQNMQSMALGSGGTSSKTAVVVEAADHMEYPCVRCKTVSAASCENCGDHYCSSECQRADWPEHRRICFPIPRLVPNPKTIASMGSAAATTISNGVPRHPAPRNHSPIIITFAVDHRRVYVRSAEPHAIEDYNQTMMAVNEAAESATPLVEPPVRSSFVLAHYDNVFYRALVLAVDDDVDQIDVAYIDFGNKERKQLADLRHMPADLMLLTRHPIEVQLAAVPERMHTDAVAQRLHCLIDAATVLQLHCSDDQVCGGGVASDGRLCKNAAVRLIDERTNECVNETLGTLNRVEVVAQTAPPLRLDDLRHVPVNGVGMDMLVLDNSLLLYNTLWCIRSEDTGKLVKNTKRFQEYCAATVGPYTPRPEEVCLAMYKGKWYRAACMEVVGDRMPTLQFIDHGCIQCVNIADIRKMPAEFAYPLITHDYAINGIDEVCDTMLPVLNAFFAVNAVVRVDKAETVQLDGRAVYVLHCERLLSALRQQQLLTSK